MSEVINSVCNRRERLVLSEAVAMAAAKPGPKGQAWFCTTGLPSDVVIEVDGMSFHLHKFPLMARSGRLQRLITEMEEKPKKATERREQSKGHEEEESRDEEGGEIEEESDGEEGEEEAAEEVYQHITFGDFPANCDAFETAAKFCYGVKIELNPWNVAPLRCAAEYLEMTDELYEDNLVSLTERFLAQSVLPSIRQSVKTLKSCEDLLPLADDLGIVQRCIDAIAVGASASNPSSLFGWPINEGRRGGGGTSEQILWNGIETGLLRRRSGVRSSSFAAPSDSWFEDLAILGLPMYKRVIATMKARDLRSDAIEGSLISYAVQSIPGLSRSRRKHSSAPVASETEQRELLETVIANLPSEKSPTALPASSAAAATKFLFGLLRTAHILHASEAARTTLERKIALQLERTMLDDLLIPSYSYLAETLYDVDCVERILGYYLDGLEAYRAAAMAEGEELERSVRTPPRARSLKLVGKLVDAYLAEVASDANLKVEKFCSLAVVLPDEARVYHDGLYRAVDIYLKAHPRLREEEKEKLCGVLDLRKLTLEACTHAAQNERLPLRAIVQVLFFEQLQLRRAITGTLLAAEGEEAATSVVAGGREGGGAWRAAMRENQVLRLDMDSMRSRVYELERECSNMKKALVKLDEFSEGGDGSVGEEGEDGERRRRRRRKGMMHGCRFSTQVCDSHERNVVESRRAAAAGRQLSP